MTIVAALLERGDVFEAFGGTRYKVIGIAGGYISYASYFNHLGSTIHKIGIHSKEKLTLIRDGDVGELVNLRKYVQPEGFIET